VLSKLFYPILSPYFFLQAPIPSQLSAKHYHLFFTLLYTDLSLPTMFARLIIISTTLFSSAHGMRPSKSPAIASRTKTLAEIAEDTGELANDGKAFAEAVRQLREETEKEEWSWKSVFGCWPKKDKKECDEAELGRQFAREQGWTSFVQGKASVIA
jgi:hypothetical protein